MSLNLFARLGPSQGMLRHHQGLRHQAVVWYHWCGQRRLGRPCSHLTCATGLLSGLRPARPALHMHKMQLLLRHTPLIGVLQWALGEHFGKLGCNLLRKAKIWGVYFAFQTLSDSFPFTITCSCTQNMSPKLEKTQFSRPSYWVLNKTPPLLFVKQQHVSATSHSHAFVVSGWLLFNILRFYEGRKTDDLSATYKSYRDVGKIHWYS